MDDGKELYSLHESSCKQLRDDFMDSSIVTPASCDLENSILDESKKSSFEIGPPCPRRMLDAKAPFRILEDQIFPEASDDESSTANAPLCESTARTPQPTFRNNRRRIKNNSVSKIFSSMALNSLPRKSPRDRTPIRHVKRKKPRLNFGFESPFSFSSGESSTFVSSPSVSASIESTRSPRPDQPKKVTPCNPKKYVMPGRPSKQRSRVTRSISAHFPRTPWGTKNSLACPRRQRSAASMCTEGSSLPQEREPKHQDLDWSKKDFMQLVTHLKRKGVRMLTLDWDNTVISIHTKNGWYETGEELSRWVRDPFRQLIKAALEAGIFVAIVTFSEQTELIIDALKHVFPRCCKKIAVFGNDESWECSCAMMQQFYRKSGIRRIGKLTHMCAAGLKKGCKKPIICSDVLLIDDDKNNINAARDQGVRAYWLCTESPNAIFWSLKKL